MIFLIFSRKTEFDISRRVSNLTMKYLILFFGTKRKNISTCHLLKILSVNILLSQRSPPLSYLESVKEEEDLNGGRIHFQGEDLTEEEEPLTWRDEGVRSQNSRIPKQKMRAILVRTPANKDEPRASPIEDEHDSEPHEPDILITELKGT